jgi:hypothetical protein
MVRSDSGQKAVPLELEHGKIQPDRTLAESAAVALSEYLKSLKAGNVTTPIPRSAVEALPVPSAPRLDESGYWRVGPWILESRNGELALTYRSVQPGTGLEYVATLQRSDQTLAVQTITMRQIYQRR